MPNKPQIFTPAGGMNQDDSLIVPAKNTAGRSLFELGDYRYALNARIGSSRSDNFGDVETIKSTEEVTDYLGLNQVFDNNTFDGSLSPWQQLDEGSGYDDWTWDATGAAKASVGLGLTMKPLYQDVTIPEGDSVTLIVNTFAKYSSSPSTILVVSGQLNLVLLDGATILSETTIFDGSFAYNSGDLITHTFTIPAGCDRIGLRVIGSFAHAVANLSINLNYASIVHSGTISIPSGTEKVIGWLEDKEFLKVYYAVWNSYGDHTIRVYDLATNTVTVLLQWSGLNWSSTTYVKMAKLDNWISLTDRTNPPRLIDVDTIGNLFASLTEDNFREYHISFHKWAPVNPPVPRIYYDGSTNNYEKLKNKNYQFAARYVYKGNLKSRVSPISKAVPTGDGFGIIALVGSAYVVNKTITAIEVTFNGFILDDPGANVEYNYFGHDDLKFSSAVDYIELFFREGEGELWKIWKRVYSFGSDAHYFSGSFDGRPVNVSDFNQQFDTVPSLAGTVEAIDNRFVFGDCLDEEEPLSTFTVEDFSVVNPTGAQDWDSSYPDAFSQFSTTIRNKLIRHNALSLFNYKNRGIYKVGIQFLKHTGWRSLAYTDDVMTIELNAGSQYTKNALSFQIPNSIKPPSWAVAYQIVRTNVLNIDYFMVGMANQFIPLLDSPNALTGMTGLSDGVKDKINQHFENSKIVDGYKVAAEIQLAELNPTNAAEAFRSRDTIKERKSLQKYLKDNTLFNILSPEVRSSIQESAVVNASRIFIDMNNWYNAAKENSAKDRPLSKMWYNFRQGDRVRFFASTVSSPTSGQIEVFDVPIIEFTGTGIIVEKPSTVLSLPKEESPWTSSFDIEIYTPKTPDESDHIFHEAGEWYPVLYPGTDNRDFSKKDWRYTSNAAVTVGTYGPFDVFSKIPFFFGDCFQISKTVYRDSVSAGEGVSVSMNPDPNETYGDWDHSNGRPSTSYLDLPISKFKPTQLRFGGKIVEESSVNALNRFREADQHVYPSEYGRVRGLIAISNAQVESVGSILLAIGEREAWSIYVNRTTLEDLSGRSQVSLSDKVLGSFNLLKGEGGTLNPESICSDRGNAYWWNAISGSWFRYGRDGLTEISSYKMRNWFREMAGLMLDKYSSDEIPRAISGFDPFNEELVTFNSHSELPATFRGYSNYKGAVFSEDDKRWKSIHNYEPELFGKIGITMLAFVGGRLHKMEAGDDDRSFFGEKVDTYIEPVFNQDSWDVKNWKAIAVNATDKWSVERFLSEYRGLKNKQQSRIPLASFELREDVYHSEIKRDLNSVNVSDPIINGKAMRSKALQVLMKLDPDVEHLSLLHYVKMTVIDSPKN